MTLIVETGTGDIAAQSYCSVADADAYHADFGNSEWAVLTTNAKEVALRKATQYMSQNYRERWDGYRRTNEQALDWPRTEVRRRDAPTTYGSATGYMVNYYPIDSVPTIVIHACAELALRSTVASLLEDLEPAVASESVGPISVSYFPGASREKKFPAVERLLQPVLSGSTSALKMVRA